MGKGGLAQGLEGQKMPEPCMDAKVGFHRERSRSRTQLRRTQHRGKEKKTRFAQAADGERKGTNKRRPHAVRFDKIALIYLEQKQ